MKNRYIRNIQTPKIGKEGQNRLKSARALIAGAGGLGSTVIANLASLGIGTLGIIDKDIIEISNLNRQFLHTPVKIGQKKAFSAKEWVNNYNPEITVHAYDIELQKENYQEIVKDYELIIDCFDSVKSKFLLNDIALQTNKTLVHAGVSEWQGQVMTISRKNPCLECVFGTSGITEPPKGVTSPLVSLIASLESIEAMKILLKEPCTEGLLHFDGLSGRLVTIKTAKDNSCLCCNKF